MIRTATHLCSILLLAVALTAPARGQEGKKPQPTADPAAASARLDSLLRELSALDAAAWSAREKALRDAAAAAEAEAAKLRERAAELEKQAAAEKARAAGIAAEIERLGELRQLLGAGVTATAAAPAPGDGKAAAAASDAGAGKDPEKVAEQVAEKVAAKAGAEGAAAKPASDSAKKDAAKPAAAPAADGQKPAPEKASATPKPAPPAKSAEGASATPAAKPTPMAAAAADGDADDIVYVTWDDHIEDLMFDQCAVCHETGDAAGGLDVSTFAGIRQGGASGRTLAPGNPDESRLFRMVAHLEKPVMPKDAPKLPADKIALLRTWIEQGASENAAEAEAFVTAKKKAAAEAAAEAAALREGAAAGPMPQGLPPVPLATPGGTLPIRTMARSPRAPLVAVAGLGQVLLLGEDGTRLGILPCPFPTVEALGFSADGALLAVAGGTPGRRGQACVFDVRTGKEVGTYGKLRDTALAVAVDAVHRLVALGGPNRELEVFGLDDGALRYTLPHPEWVLTCAFSPDGRHLASGDRAGRLWVWLADSGRDVAELRGHGDGVHGVAFSPTGKALASVGGDGSLRLWDPATGKQRWSKTAHAGGALAVAHGVEAIATGGADGRLKLWKTDGNSLRAPGDLGDWVYSVALLDGDGRAWAGSWDGRVHTYEREAREQGLVELWDPALAP